MRSGIDRASLLPFCHQLKQILLGQIEQRGLRPGDRLRSDVRRLEVIPAERPQSAGVPPYPYPVRPSPSLWRQAVDLRTEWLGRVAAVALISGVHRR